MRLDICPGSFCRTVDTLPIHCARALSGAEHAGLVSTWEKLIRVVILKVLTDA